MDFRVGMGTFFSSFPDWNFSGLFHSLTASGMVVLARQNGQLKKEIKKWKKDWVCQLATLQRQSNKEYMKR
jgi:hypothetical protein